MVKFFLNATLESPLLPLECIILALVLEQYWFALLCKPLYLQGDHKRILPEPLLLYTKHSHTIKPVLLGHVFKLLMVFAVLL